RRKSDGRGSRRDAAPRRRAARGARRQSMDRLQRRRRARRADRLLCRSRLPESGVPRAGTRPGALSEALRRARAAAAAQAFRLRARDRPMKRSNAVEILVVPGIPLVRKDDDLVALIGEGLARGGIVPRGGDVFVLTQKIVSKAEGRMVDLATVKPSAEAIELAGKVQKDPRLVELILSESVRVVRARPGVLIVEHRLGLVMANAGIDQSNVASPGDPQRALLLPVDPDGSAAILRKRLS